MAAYDHLNQQQFAPKLYHGTNAQMSPGDYVESGWAPHGANFPGAEYGDDEKDLSYATPLRSKAHYYASNAVDEHGGKQHTYEVTPTASPVHFDSEVSPEDYESDEEMNRKGARQSEAFKVKREVKPVYTAPGGKTLWPGTKWNEAWK